MNNKVGYMQGRLVDMVDGKIQAFPWRDWELEFDLAGLVGLRVMEWTLDHDRLNENPIMTEDGRRRIAYLCGQHSIDIDSLTGDCFMQAPFWKASNEFRKTLQQNFIDIAKASSKIGIKIIVIPLVDYGALESVEQETILVDFLLKQEPLLQQLGVQVAFESEYDPSALDLFIRRFPSTCFGINYDMGNSAALGFNPEVEFSLYGSRIINVHVKDRIFMGTTVTLGEGSVNFTKVFSLLRDVNYSGNYILQTARATSGQHTSALLGYKNLVISWVKQVSKYEA